MITSRRDRLAAGLVALGFAPSVRSSGERWTRFIHFGHRAKAMLHDCGALQLAKVGNEPRPATEEQERAVRRAAERAKR